MYVFIFYFIFFRFSFCFFTILLIKTYLNISKIHGIGCFAGEFVSKDSKIAEFDINFDRKFSYEEFIIYKNYIEKYGYFENNEYFLNMDNMKFFNHSENPTTYSKNFSDFALKDIHIGEELTCNYFDFDEFAKLKLH